MRLKWVSLVKQHTKQSIKLQFSPVDTHHRRDCKPWRFLMNHSSPTDDDFLLLNIFTLHCIASKLCVHCKKCHHSSYPFCESQCLVDVSEAMCPPFDMMILPPADLSPLFIQLASPREVLCSKILCLLMSFWFIDLLRLSDVAAEQLKTIGNNEQSWRWACEYLRINNGDS